MKVLIDRIAQAFKCANGEHEELRMDVPTTGLNEIVRLSFMTQMHTNIYCRICEHCHTVYIAPKK